MVIVIIKTRYESYKCLYQIKKVRCSVSNVKSRTNFYKLLRVNMRRTRSTKRLSSQSSGSSEGSTDGDLLVQNRDNAQQDLDNMQQQHGLRDEKTKQLSEREKSILAGTHPDYLRVVERLKQEMNNKLEGAEKLRQARLSSFRLKFEAEQLAIKQTYQAERRKIKNDMAAEIKQRIKALKASRDEDFDTRIRLQMARNPAVKQKKTKAERIQLAKRSRTTLPIIIYQLKEIEVLEDLAVVKQALARKARLDKKKIKKAKATLVA